MNTKSVFILFAMFGSGVILMHCAIRNGETINSFFLNLSTELFGAVIVFFLIDQIIGSSEKKNDLQSRLIRDLYDKDNRVKELALNELARRKWTKGADLKRVDFSGMTIVGMDFSKTNFFDSNFFGTNFEGCQFKRTIFWGSDMRGCTMIACELRKVDMRDVNADGIFLEGGAVEDVDFSGASMIKSTFSNVKRCRNLRGIDADVISFYNCTPDVVNSISQES